MPESAFDWAVGLFLVLMSIALRVPYLHETLDRDFGGYFRAAWFRLKMYDDEGHYDWKPALIFAWAWLVVRVLGREPWRLRMGYVLTHAVNTGLVWLLGGVPAAALYALISASPLSWHWMASSATVYLTPLLTALAVWKFVGISWMGVVAMGLLAGAAFQVNIRTAYTGPLFLVLLWHGGATLLQLAGFCAAWWAPFVGVCLYMLVTGRLANYLRWTFRVPFLMSVLRAKMGQIEHFSGFATPWLMQMLPLLPFAALKAVDDPWNAAIWLLLAEGLTIFASGQLVPHHFQGLDPYLALLVGGVVAVPHELAVVGLLAFAVVTMAFKPKDVYRQWFYNYHTHLEPMRYVLSILEGNFAIEDGKKMEVPWLRPEDTLVLNGTEPQLFFYVDKPGIDPYPARGEYRSEWVAALGWLPPLKTLIEERKPDVFVHLSTGMDMIVPSGYGMMGKPHGSGALVLLREEVIQRVVALAEQAQGEHEGSGDKKPEHH